MKTKYIITKATLAFATVLLLGTACSSHKSVPAGQPAINQNSGAPAALMGKTIVWDYTHAALYEGEDGEPLSLVHRDNNIVTEAFTSIHNTGIDSEGNRSTHGVRSGTYLVKSNNKYSGYDYMKTGHNSGTLTIYGWEDMTTYSLHFDSADTGTATYSGEGEGANWKGSGIRFAIK